MVAVSNEHWLLDARQIGRLLRAPVVDCFEMSPERGDGNRVVAVLGALLEPVEEVARGRPASWRRGEEQVVLRIAESDGTFDHVQVGQWRDLFDALAASGPGSGEDDLADKLGVFRCDDLGHESAHREPEQINLLEPERLNERDCVVGHLGDRTRGRSLRCADASVIEGNHSVLGGEAIHDRGSQLSNTAARWLRKMIGVPVRGPRSRDEWHALDVHRLVGVSWYAVW